MITELLKELREQEITISLSNGDLKLKYNTPQLPVALLDKIKQQKQQLIAYLTSVQKQNGGAELSASAIQDGYPLSSSQLRLWVLSQFNESNVAYNMPGVYLLEGNLRREALEYAFHSLICRHESLRTVFREDGKGEVLQFVQTPEEARFKINYRDLRMDLDGDATVRELVELEFLLPFDLERGPLIRVTLFHVEENKWVLSYVMHHIISDRWSMEILIQELSLLYNTFLKGQANPLSPLPIQYKDYAVWQQRCLKGNSFVTHRGYWINQLQKPLPVLDILGDLPRPAIKTYNGGYLQTVIPKEAVSGLKTLIQRKGGTLFMGLLSVVNVLLHRYSNQDDIIVGTPIAGRDHLDLERQIGLYLNTLPIRTRFNASSTFNELLLNVRSVTLQAFEHQQYPLDEVLEELNLERDLSRSALFDVLVVLQNTDIQSIRHHENIFDVELRQYALFEQPTSKFDLTFEFVDTGSTFKLSVGYNSDIFFRSTIEKLIIHFQKLLSELLAYPDKAIAELDFISEEDTRTILYGFNNTYSDIPNKGLAALFDDQVNYTPDKTCVIYEENSLTYREVNQRANRLADFIRKKLNPSLGDRIAIVLPRSEDYIICILAILKTGAAYVPIDPEYPQERIALITSDCDAIHTINEDFLQNFSGESNSCSSDPSKPVASSKDLAYIMYTSGSTGKPKGVMVEHQSVVRLVRCTNYVSIGREDVMLSLSNFSFDGSVFDIFGALLNGATLVLASKINALDFNELNKTIESKGVTVFFITTALFNAWVDGGPLPVKKLKYVLFGGEKVSTDHVHAFKNQTDRVTLVHVYGPTENTTFSLAGVVEEFSDTVPIGSPISNSTAYIFNDYQKLVPIGVPGEICTGGQGVARGYVNAEKLTAEKFIRNPYSPNEIIYRTGDIGKWLPDGRIEFIGRKDGQVKIRGFRIELAEIEHALRTHEAISSAFVLAESNESGDKELLAYYVTASELSALEVRKHVSAMLPSYMVPNHFVWVSQLPLNANGKVDKNKLPKPSFVRSVECIAPRNEAEITLLGIWQNILGRENISVLDNFFELGGHSLRATRLASQIHKQFNVKLSLKELFARPTLEEQARMIAQTARISFVHISPAPWQLSYPLSSSQRRLWALSQAKEGNIANNISGVYILDGDVDVDALCHSFNAITGRHEILRTAFIQDNTGQPVQIVNSADDVKFELAVRSVTENETLAKRQLIEAETSTPFDLEKAPLMRCTLFLEEGGRNMLVFTMHHIISDGWSMNILLNELLLHYNSQLRNEAVTLLPLRIHYKDFAVWQQQSLLTGDLAEHRHYWMKQFQRDIPVLEFPADKPRPKIKTYEGGCTYRRIEKPMLENIRRLMQEQNATLFMGLLSCTYTLLSRYSGQTDIIIGTPIAGREHADLEDQIGFYVNTLPLLITAKQEQTFSDLLTYVREITLSAYRHQAYPFDQLLDDLNIQRDISRSPLFDTMVVLQNASQESIGGITSETLVLKEYREPQKVVSRFDLTFDFSEKLNGLDMVLIYNKDIYHESSMERLSDHFVQLLQSILEHLNTPISQINFLPHDEKQLLLSTDQMLVAFPKDETILSLFERQVKKTPHAVAVVFDDLSLTYQQLHEKSNSLAHYLRSEFNVSRHDMVALLLERSEQMIISILAVLKSGATYVPMDPAYPDDRISFMVRDSACKAIVNNDLLREHDRKNGIGDISDLPIINSPGDVAYVIYTSGTTGQPKGVMVQHDNVVRLFFNDKPLFDFGPSDVWTMFHSYCFDFSVWEMYGALFYGGKLIIVPHRVAQDSKVFWNLLVTSNVTVLNQTPSAFYNLIQTSHESSLYVRSLRYVIFGGEALSPGKLKSWKRIYPDIKLVNMYGITETTVHVTYKLIREEEIESNVSNIGKAIPTLKCYVLDKNQQLVPFGVPGELYVAGAGVARGYLNREELTSKRFVPNPFRGGERLYRSGDLARILDNGELEYLGRIDHQVKIRGYRIELGEIDARLQNHHFIKDAVTLARPGVDGEQELVAYIVCHSPLKTAAIRAYLTEVLPSYMVPSHFVIMESIPLTSNGKVDRKKLPSHVESITVTGDNVNASPRHDVDRALIQIWKEVLGKENVGRTDNFFELGGHSLKATRLISQIHKSLHVKVELNDIFSNPVLEAQSDLIRKCRQTGFEAISPAPILDDYPLSSSQKRMWILSQLDGASVAYNMPAFLISKGSLKLKALEQAFVSVIGRHEVLRTVFTVNSHGEPRQVIQPPEHAKFTLNYIDLRKKEQGHVEGKELIQREFLQPFDLSKGPLLRASVCQMNDDTWWFAFTMHHIISDGWSMNILVREVEAFYNAHVLSSPAALSPLRINYKDFAVWQQGQLESPLFRQDKEYWITQFSQPPPVLQLPLDRPRPKMKTYKGSSVQTVIDAEVSQQLNLFCQQRKGTLFMGLLAATTALLHRYTGQDDIVTGSLIAGREHSDLEDQIGFYVNTLALRIGFDPSASFLQLFEKVRAITLDAYNHQRYPFDELLEALHFKRDISRNPLFDVMVVLQNARSEEDLALTNVNGLSIEGQHGGALVNSMFDLLFNFTTAGDTLKMTIGYNTDLFNPGTIQRMCGHLMQLLKNVSALPAIPVNQIELLGTDEMQTLLEFTVRNEETKATTVIEEFERRVCESPQTIALVSDDDSITYGELDLLSNRFARFLQKDYGIAGRDIVAIKLRRSPEYIAAMLAVLKTGAAFLPIDPSYPVERINFMLEDSHCKALIDDSFVKEFVLQQDDLASSFPLHPPSERDIAYVIYTSGSSGLPKGVLIEHRSLTNLCAWHWTNFNVNEKDRATCAAALGFDASIWEVFPYLTRGASLYIVPEDVRFDVQQLSEFYERNKITIAFLPTHVGESFIKEKNNSLRHLLVGGDKLKTYMPTTYRLWNNYGPTENTVVSTCFEVREPGNPIPIGKPISNVELYIMNDQQKLCPIGVVGEIYLSGKGLARGYINNESLTKEKFLENPFNPGTSMYKTGDLGRWRDDGTVEFAGRKDQQVKTRGYRVELGEIEYVINSFPGVDAAIVIALTTTDDAQLVAYIKSHRQMNASDIIAYLKTKLPSFMIPSSFVQVDAFPLTANDKIDFSALNRMATERIDSGVSFISPRNETEDMLVKLWQQLLDRDRISVSENFFDIGGHSLKATKLIAEIRKQTDVRVSLNDVFAHPTIEEQAALINKIKWLKADVEMDNEIMI